MAAAGTRAQIHPLVLLSITEKISRDVTRGYTVPFLGGIVGQVTREGITLEHEFDVRLDRTADGSAWQINEKFFNDRLWQMKEVHKEPAQLDLVAFWTLGKAGASPGAELDHILPTILRANPNTLALIFHADLIADGTADENQMPFTIHEPTYNQQPEGITAAAKDPIAVLNAFKVIPWEFVTGEAEMISLEAVKNGGGNATRVKTGAQSDATDASAIKDTPGIKSDAKEATDEKAKAQQKKSRAAAADLYTAEEEEMLSFLTTRANAIRTLLNRLKSIKGFVEEAGKTPESANSEGLRAVKAMLARLPGVEAAKNAQISSKVFDGSSTQASTGATADPGMTEALLVELLGSIGKNLQSTRDLGGKFSVVEAGKRERSMKAQNGGYGDHHFGGAGHSEMMDLT